MDGRFEFRRVLRRTVDLLARSIGPVLRVGTLCAIVGWSLDKVVGLTFPVEDFLKAFFGIVARYFYPEDDFAKGLLEFIASLMVPGEDGKLALPEPDDITDGTLERVPVSLMLWGGAVMLYSLLYQLMFYGAVLVTVVKVARGDSWPMAQALRAFFGRLGTLFLVKVLETVAVMLGFLCLIIPGILLFLRFYIADAKVFTSNLNAIACLRQSSALSSRHMGQVALQILVVKAVMGFVSSVLRKVFVSAGFGALRERLSVGDLLPKLAETIWQSVVTAIWCANMLAVDVELSDVQASLRVGVDPPYHEVAP